MRLIALTTAILIAITAHPQSYHELIAEGTKKMELGDTETAIKSYNEAIALEPDNKKNEFIYANLALAYEKCNNEEKAEEMYDKALSFNPKSPRLLQQRGNMFLRTDKWDKALADYDSIIVNEPFNEEALYFRAYIYSEKKKYEKAYEDYYRILTVNPENHKTRFALALLLHKHKKSEEALLTLDVLIEKNPDNPEYYLTCSDIAKSQKREELALVYIEEGLSKCNKKKALYTEKARLLITANRKDEARSILNQLIKEGGNLYEINSLYNKTTH